MGEIILPLITNRTVGRKSELTEEQKSFIEENASKMNIPAMAAELGVPYHKIDSFVKSKKLDVVKKWRQHVKKDLDYEAGGVFNIDRYNPSTI